MARLAVQYFQLFLVALGLTVSQLLLKHGMRSGGPVQLSLGGLAHTVGHVLTTPTLLLGYALGGFTTLIWLGLLSRLELSFASPTLMGFYFVLLLVASRLVLHETVSVWNWLGTLCLVVGIVLLAQGR